MSALSLLLPSTSNVFGSARFLGGYERLRLLSRFHDGLVIDGRRRISEKRSFNHLAIVAPSGGGKTTVFTIPNVLALNGSAVITDPSGEIYAHTAGHLQAKGFKIKVIDLGDPARSLTFNPLHRANEHDEIANVADVLIRSAFPGSNANDQFWNSGARSILNILIRALKTQPEELQTLHNVRHLLNSFGKDGKGIGGFIFKSLAGDAATLSEFKGFVENEPKVVLNFVATAKNALEAFANPKICALTATETLHFESLRDEKTAIFIHVPEHQIHHYSFFLNLLYTQIFAFCMRMPGPKEESIFFLLDEFGNMGRFPDFSQLMTTLRKRRCSVSVVLQDVSQLVKVYGHDDANTILDGACASRIFLPGLSHRTCRELEDILGKMTVRHTEEASHPLDTDPTKFREREVGRSLLTADEIRTMKDHQAIYLYRNKRPARLHLKPFHRNWRLRRQAGIPAPNLATRDIRPTEYIKL
ncbi:type IV secretory system conjugative DNA transfer family protein [Rhodothermus sp. AH-315-K08]|nr:type IV secretory system conjugative DNA transfer family protein [Rhodothermus sp. AH-315-K08]